MIDEKIKIRYNKVRTKSSDVELELLLDELEMIDNMIDDGQINYNWNSPGLWFFFLFFLFSLSPKSFYTLYKLVIIELNKVDEIKIFNIITETPEYVENLLSFIRKLHSRVIRGQDNITKLIKMIYEWAILPVLERKDSKIENLLDIEEREEKFKKRYNFIEATNSEIKRILDENYKLYFNLLPESAYAKDEFELATSELEPDEADAEAAAEQVEKSMELE